MTENSVENRNSALILAVELAVAERISPTAQTICEHAQAFYDFLEGSIYQVSAAKAEAPKEPATRKTRSSPKPETPPAEATNSSTVETAAEPTGGEWDDTPAPAEKVKETTIEDVRAALTKVQTELKSKEKALAILKSVSGGTVLSGLKKEDYAKLVAACAAAK